MNKLGRVVGLLNGVNGTMCYLVRVTLKTVTLQRYLITAR